MRQQLEQERIYYGVVSSYPDMYDMHKWIKHCRIHKPVSFSEYMKGAKHRDVLEEENEKSFVSEVERLLGVLDKNAPAA